MAKIIDPDNYVPHHLPIPGIEKAKPIDWTKYPLGLVTDEEADEFFRMIREMRRGDLDLEREPWK
jgi:hypothetical protein